MNDIILNYKVKLYYVKNSNHLKFINSVVDKIYIINLKKDKMRRNYILILMKKLPLY